MAKTEEGRMEEHGLTEVGLANALRGRHFLYELAVRAIDDAELSGCLWEASVAYPGDSPRESSARAARALDDALNALGAQLSARMTVDLTEAAMQDVVDEARYWQAPEREQRMVQDPEWDAVLRRVEGSFMRSPGLERLTEAWDSESQWVRATRREGRYPFFAAAQWRASISDEEDNARAWTEPVSADWWSIPLCITSHEMRAEASWEEDSFGENPVWTRLAVWPEDRPALRRYVISCGEDLKQLVETYPCEVSASRRWDWKETTGRDGAWFIPDFAAMAHDWDAVTLTPLGYLLTAGTVTRLDSADIAGRADTAPHDGDADCATVVAGWNPGSTIWLSRPRLSDAELCWRRQECPEGSGRYSWEVEENRNNPLPS